MSSLTYWMKRAERREKENATLRAALETVQQAFVEISHARQRPDWFTRGESGAWSHSRMWEERGIAAAKSALEAAKAK